MRVGCEKLTKAGGKPPRQFLNFMNDDFPRLLVATEFPPNGGGGGAAIARQMLKGWPVEKLFWWSCSAEVDTCFGQKVAAHSSAQIPQKLYPHRRWREQKGWLLEQVWTPWAARHFRQTAAAFQPEVIWHIPHAWSIPPLARVLPTIPAGVHVSLHDYMDIDAYITRFGRDRCQRLARLADQVYASATTRDAIGQAMLADLQQRTGQTGRVIRAGLEAADFDFLNTPPAPKPDGVRIAYAGSIQVESVFPVFIAALNKIRPQLPAPVSLEFYGTGNYHERAWFDPAWMTGHGNLPLPQLAAALKQCTWGFAPMDLTDGDPRYNRFSLPTKFISYLAAGLPIITMGHPESSVVKMATAHAVGICLTTADESELAAQLLATLGQPGPGAKFRAAIQHCAATEFDAVNMRETLHQCLQQCARQRPRP